MDRALTRLLVVMKQFEDFQPTSLSGGGGGGEGEHPKCLNYSSSQVEDESLQKGERRVVNPCNEYLLLPAQTSLC